MLKYNFVMYIANMFVCSQTENAYIDVYMGGELLGVRTQVYEHMCQWNLF